MVRVLALLVIFSFSLHAVSFYKEIENITGKNSYIANKKIIRAIFKNPREFYKGSHIDYERVLQKLKENNLLKLKLSRSTQIGLSFATKQNHPLVFVHLIKTTLNELGFSRIDIQKVIKDESGFMYKVAVYSDTAPDPILISDAFIKRGCEIVKIKRFSISNWRYFVDISNINIVPQKLPYKKKVHLSKPLEPYWINVSNAKIVLLNSSRLNGWHPYIVFYDKNLQIVDNYSKDIKSYNVRLEIPKNAKYMKISDIYTLENLKKGLTIYLANRK